jgi:hypothetical protein
MKIPHASRGRRISLPGMVEATSLTKNKIEEWLKKKRMRVNSNCSNRNRKPHRNRNPTTKNLNAPGQKTHGLESQLQFLVQ